MSTAYVSSRFPVAFTPKEPNDIQNGCQALSSIVYTLADNQQWLASEDVDVVNFHQGWGGTTKEWNNGSNTIRVMIPPFCQYAGFHFYVARDMDTAGGQQPVLDLGIQLDVLGGTSRAIHNIAHGEVLGIKPKFSNEVYAWEHMDGISQNPEDFGPSAVKLVSSTSETWTSVRVSITMGTKVYCRAAAYHIIPNRTGYIVTV